MSQQQQHQQQHRESTPPPQPFTSSSSTTTTDVENTPSSSKAPALETTASITSEQNHVQLLMSALEKLDPEKNGLDFVSKDITSSTLTTRLKAVCNINRLIEHSNDLSHPFSEIGAQDRYQECTDKFRDWILNNKIIEHIFGPNCHVEIIKQSHSILNFVAYSLTDKHVDVIWSASLLKHCGRQVLDLLTSLIRFMKSGPVLHLYWLVRNLNVEDHSEHTLLLSSHISRFIWSHSPCINQIQFCTLQKQHKLAQDSNQDLDQSSGFKQQQYYTYFKRRFPYTRQLQSHDQQQHHQQQNSPQFKKHPPQRQYQRQCSIQSVVNAGESDANITTAENTRLTNSITTTATTSTPNAYTSYTGEDDLHWLNESSSPRADRSASSRSTSDSADIDKDLQRSVIDAIAEGVIHHRAIHDNSGRRPNSPISETIAKGSGDGLSPADDVKKSVVDHILRSISAESPAPDDKSSSLTKRVQLGEYTELAESSHCDSARDAQDKEWVAHWKDSNEFLDNTSDASACCSEDKNMGDFDDEGQGFMQDENANGVDGQSVNSSGASDLFVRRFGLQNESPKAETTLTSSSRSNTKEHFVSASTSRDSEVRSRLSVDQSLENLQQISSESITHLMELKKASLNLSNITSQICDDDDLKGLSEYNLANLSESGRTLLWDLLQDGKIEQLSGNLHIEVENVLVNLVMSFGDRYIRYKFIEACLENLSVGTSVIISLRLLPKLMSFNTITRNLSIPAVNETYTIVLWAEQEHNMSQKFFKNLVEYYNHRRQLILNKSKESNLSQSDNCGFRHIDEHEELDGKSMFTHIDKIITRMSFLTFIYSKPFSPVTMKLNQEQMDQLWDCLTSDINQRCSDVLFQWIYQQAVGDDFHGVDDELLDYVLKHKLPTLKPEHFRLRGLKLLEQLLWIRQEYECCHELEHPATRLLWYIGLKAVDDEVSMAAIRILNHFYIYTNHQKLTNCDKGINFIRYCMEHLQSSLETLKSSTQSDEISQSLDVMQKVILLVRTHLEVFKAHWSFYLRILQLNGEADLISHRLSAYDIKLTMTIRLVIQAASSMDKTTIEVQANDFVGELRAEIVKWWYSQVNRNFHEQSTTFSPASSSSSYSNQREAPEENAGINQPSKSTDSNRKAQQFKTQLGQLDTFTTFLLTNHHSLRLLSHNQEIPVDWDERQINELDFKDMQVVYVISDANYKAIDSTDDLASEKSDESVVYFPKTSAIPSIILQDRVYFERLMEVDQFLGSFHNNNPDQTNRAKTISRRVWEIIQILPTCPYYKDDLKRCGTDEFDQWSLKTDRCSALLSADCPQKLLYSLQIIDILRSSHECPYWGPVFIRKDGLADLYDVFMSQKLLPDDGEDWNEWLQECLAYLLKLLYQFGAKSALSPNVTDCSSSSTSSSKICLGSCSSKTDIGSSSVASNRRMRKNRVKFMAANEDRVLIPQFSDELLKLLSNTDVIFEKLIRILRSSALCKNQNDQYYYVTVSSRAMIVHHVMSFLSSWCRSDIKFPEFQVKEHENLLKALILDDTDTSTRREACNGFFKLHYARLTRSIETSMKSSEYSSLNSSSISDCNSDHSLNSDEGCNPISKIPDASFSANLLSCLVKFLPIAERMRPPRALRNYLSETEYIKELISPGCKDYFWLTCRLIDAPNTCISSQHRRTLENSHETVDLFNLCEYLVQGIRRRKTYETRDFSVEDDALRGMLMMMVMSLRRDPSFRYTEAGYDFVLELYGYLFASPTESCRYLPKCKSSATRSTAFDLMISLVERCPKNYLRLLNQLLCDQHQAVVKGSYPTDYWPHDDCRSDVGFVGLINLGATCYLATCMQHLFMIPDLRYAILSLEDTKSIRHGEIMRELQKIFAFMLESERKAYNPRNFCKVYTMDNHPLNIAEQTDMTEFLTDLITKIEESSPNLRHIIKSLFSGTLSNNVVSLDCPHISRTTEEFYTLRVQVADMRNLNDSLDELTVKDTLEGDNMYTCSTCEKKVRAEKRACIVKLPRILCFNTMRYTFNMATMTKEKVNTHFSFPLKLDMSDYLETNLMKRQQSSSSSPGTSSTKVDTLSSSSSSSSSGESTKMEDDSSGESQTSNHGATKVKNEVENNDQQDYQDDGGADHHQASNTKSGCDDETDTLYELIGVTVHTGNADGGHYYCFIRDCEDQSIDKPRWYLFNDAEVKPFDDSHIGSECYGGELTTKSYDAINDRFMDFSIEKTNSAYMLFYKRVDYKYCSKSVASRYLESDTERASSYTSDASFDSATAAETDEVPSDSSRMDTDRHQDHHHSSDIRRPVGTISEVDMNISDSDSDPASRNYCINEMDFDKLCSLTYDDFKLPRHLANWVWSDNLRFTRDKYIFEHNYFNFMWQICANIPRTLNQLPVNVLDMVRPSSFTVPEGALAIETVHLAIIFVLGVLMNSRERPNLSNWTELIRKQFNTSKAACDWLMQLIDDEETWLKQMLLKCPIEMVRQLFQRLCNDLTGSSKQHKKLRLIK